MHPNQWLDKAIIFECLSGSHAYGLNTPESDMDYRGVCIPPKDYFLGLFTFEQTESKDPDRVIYNIHKYVKLAIENNPNILEFLFTPEDCILKTTPTWEKLLAIRDAFLSKKSRFTYAGYAYSQIKRVKTHRAWLLNPPVEKPTREKYDLPIYEKLPNELLGAIDAVIKGAIKEEIERLIREGAVSSDSLKEFVREDVALAVEDALIEHVIPVITKNLDPTPIIMDVGKKFFNSEIMAIYEREKAYKNALTHWNQYQNWVKNRNQKRADLERKFGYDTKHMSHVFRLLIQGEEILGKGTLSVRLAPADRDFCKAVKEGGFTYDELIERADSKIETTFEELYKTSPLQRSADLHKINTVVMEIVESFI